MKRRAALLLLVISSAFGGEAFELAAYMSSGGVHLVVIRDPKKDVSRWLKVGETWRGYRLLSFEPESRKLTLIKNSVAQTVSFPPPPAPRISLDMFQGCTLRSFEEPNQPPPPAR